MAFLSQQNLNLINYLAYLARWLHQLIASAFNQYDDQYVSSSGNRVYCCADLAVSLTVVKKTISSTDFETVHQKVFGVFDFWATVCKTVRPIAIRPLSVLSVCFVLPVYDVCAL